MIYYIRPHPSRPKTPWKLEFRKNANEKLARFYKTEVEAFIAAEQLSAIIDEGGFEAVRLNVRGLTVSKAISKFRESRKDKGDHAAHMNRILSDFEDAHGKKELPSITPILLDKYWDRPNWKNGKSTRRQVYVYLRIFFNWCERYELLEKNPIKKVDAPKVPKPLKNVLQPMEMARLLRRARERNLTDMLAYLALCGFAGLRTEEFLALSPADVSKQHNEVHIKGGKTGERYVDGCAALWKWLPADWRNYSEMQFLRHRRLIADGDWDANCLRHSFATYHLAEFRNANETAHQMGHSDARMVTKTYALASRRAKSAEWWAL